MAILSWIFTSKEKQAAMDLPPVQVHSVETAPEKRPRTLKHLLRANHTNHALLYSHLRFDNHMVHILCSAYLLGAEPAHLYRIYDAQAKQLEAWTDSPSEIIQEDWRDFLGNKTYQRAYVDFFEDALAMRYAYDWRKVVEEYMFGGTEPLMNCLIGGLGHPLIHLGYAYEMDNRDVAIEALALTATQYGPLHKYMDDAAYTRPSHFSSTSPLELLDKLAGDARLDGIFKRRGMQNFDRVFDTCEHVLLEYWNAWTLAHPVEQLAQSMEAAVALLVATVRPGTHAYNFFLMHTLSTSHAVRILLPFLPGKYHVCLVRQWWMLVLAVYMAELRPNIDMTSIPGDLKGRSWDYVEHQALTSVWATDSHYVKAIRAMKEAARTWGDAHKRYLAAALRFVDEFKGWVT